MSIQVSENEIRNMIRPSGFIAVWFRNLKVSKTHQEAYDKTEDLYSQYFGNRKYRSYESFRSAKSYHDKSQRS